MTKISLNINGILSSNNKEVADCFNQYFSNISTSIRSKLPYTSKKFKSYLLNSNPDSVYLTPTSALEVLNCINSFPRNKGMGPYSIPIKILQLLGPDISVILSNLINLSFTSGSFPSKLKLARITPVLKKGSPLEVQNYRPISLLSNIDKIFQKLIFKRLMNFLDKHQSLYPMQFGFRAKHSTTLSLMNIVNQIQNALDKGKVACGIFLDLQKAFDTVDHEILLVKLKHYGIRGKTFHWLKSFLSERSQFVSIGNIKSSIVSLLHGVPQGSVLGPLLFLIYINDMHQAVKFSSLFQFADDTNMLNYSKNLKQLAKHVNIDLKLISHWLNANKISLNTSKTELVLFKHKRKSLTFDLRITINGKRIRPSPYIKYLGIFIDENK